FALPLLFHRVCGLGLSFLLLGVRSPFALAFRRLLLLVSRLGPFFPFADSVLGARFPLGLRFLWLRLSLPLADAVTRLRVAFGLGLLAAGFLLLRLVDCILQPLGLISDLLVLFLLLGVRG